MLAEQTAFSTRVLPRRWLSRAFNWIPDVNAIPVRRLVAIGIMVSVILHLLILVAFIAANLVLPKREDRLPTPSAAPLQVELVPMPSAQADPLVPKRRPVIDANGLVKSETKPENAEFESDRDMVAGAEKPASGNINMPSQDGRTDLPGLSFADQDLVLGVTPADEPLPKDQSDPSAPPSPDQPAKVAESTVKPLYKPMPVEKTEIAKAETAKPTDQLPEPAKPVRATPPPFKTSDRPDETTIAMLRTTPRPVSQERGEAPETRPRPPQPAPMPRKPSSITDRFQENLRKTGVEGAITTKGRNGVNAINTPMGRYRRRMGQQIESLWNLKRQGHIGDLGGTVRIGVRIAESGRLEQVQVVDDGGNPQHTEICLQAVREMRPEPMPPEAEPLLENGSLEMTFSFTLY